jgi:outer membrane protein assembly factor BamB
MWPAAAIVALQAGTILLSQASSIDNFTRFVSMMLGPGICALLAILWVVFFARLSWIESLATVAIAGLLGFAAGQAVHPSMQVTVWIYGVPLAIATASLGLLLGRHWRRVPRMALVATLLAAGWSVFLFGRNHGFDGDYLPQIAWRWSPSPEELLVASQSRKRAAGGDSATWSAATVEWPGFRGATRDGSATDSVASLDWTDAAPREVWRIKVGPGWGSFAHVSGRLYTQEQRGDDEAVVCYDAATGAEVWRQSAPSRFSEVVSGAGPRATPTYADGRLFALGARGVFMALDAASGEVQWTIDFAEEWNAPVPMWGFSASPLVVGDSVIVYADGSDGRALVALDAATGELRWKYGAGGMNYSSAQPAEIDGQSLVLFTDDAGLHALDPTSGKALATSPFPANTQAPMVQPQQVGPNTVIVALGDGVGVTCTEITREGDAWSAERRWDSRDLKPSFNDFVHRHGYLYGFDQNMLACIDTASGKRQWKRGRYGFGQVLLLPNAGRLLVLGEKGQVVTLAANPKRHEELGQFQAIEGKTWNHPIVVGSRLFVRNGEEAACYDLSAPAPVAGEVAAR